MKLADDVCRQIYDQRLDGDGVPTGSKATGILDFKDLALNKIFHFESEYRSAVYIYRF